MKDHPNHFSACSRFSIPKHGSGQTMQAAGLDCDSYESATLVDLDPGSVPLGIWTAVGGKT